MAICMEPVTLPASALLKALVVRVKDYCVEKKCDEPAEIVAMYPPVEHALESGEEDYIELIYSYFSIVVQGSLLGKHVYEQEVTQ